MPPPTASLKPAPKAPKEKADKAAVPAAKVEGDKAEAGASRAKPDQAAYNQEQEKLNKEIEVVKGKLNDVRNKLALLHSPAGNENDRRSQIRAEMDALQGAQGQAKGERTKTLDQVKRLQEGVQQKIKDVQAQRSKMPYKNVEEIDQRIAALNKQVESGQLKLIDEKKALAEITSLRRAQRTFASSGSLEDGIAADRAKIDELRKVLDDPENKRVQARWDELKAELDKLRAEGSKAFEERSGLFDQRNALSKELDVLYGRKRDSATKHREAGDAYWARIKEDRQAKADKFRQEKAVQDAAKREEEITRLREEARMPAYAAQIEDCGVLIGWFKGRFAGGRVPEVHAGAESASEKAALEGVKKLEIRKVEDQPIGVPMKKKGDDEETWGGFAGGGKKKGKGGFKKGSTAPSGAATPATAEEPIASASTAVNVPMALLSALLSLSIPPPTNKDDVPRCISDLETKKAWFEANNERKTKEEIERVESLVKKMQKKNEKALAGSGANGEADDEDEQEVEGAKEPVHTAAVAGDATHDVPVSNGHEDAQLPTRPSEDKLDEVDSAIEEVKESA